MFGRRGSVAGSIFTTGPIIATVAAGYARASSSTRARSIRSSITPMYASTGRPSNAASAGCGAHVCARAKCSTSTPLG